MSAPSADPFAERYVSLATFRRDGTEVRTPVWIVRLDDRGYVFTAGDSGKVKRVRASSKVRIAACGVGGRVHGPWRRAGARLLSDPVRAARVYREFRRKYGWQMWLTDALSRLGGRYAKRAVIELWLEA